MDEIILLFILKYCIFLQRKPDNSLFQFSRIVYIQMMLVLDLQFTDNLMSIPKTNTCYLFDLCV